MSNTTLKSIALKLGVSVSTVSKALNDSHEISDKTKKKVTKIAKNLNYKPNFYAKNLKKKDNFVLGVILPDLSDDFFLNVLIGITEESSKMKHRIMVYQSCNDIQKEKNYTKLLSDYIIDGLIFSPITSKNFLDKNKYLKQLLNNDLPIEIVNKELMTIVNSKSKKGVKVGQDIAKKLINRINHPPIQLGVS
ncbi:MAG: LacI family DNA-binding transcriptional regulator [Flavobacteriaceae bacterium]